MKRKAVNIANENEAEETQSLLRCISAYSKTLGLKT